MTWRWENNDFIWTIPLKKSVYEDLERLRWKNNFALYTWQKEWWHFLLFWDPWLSWKHLTVSVLKSWWKKKSLHWHWVFMFLNLDQEINETYWRSDLQPFNSHTLILALIQNLRHSCGERLNNTMRFICTQMFVHTGDPALTLPRVNQTSVQQGEILANILSAYTTTTKIGEAMKGSRLYLITKYVFRTLQIQWLPLTFNNRGKGLNESVRWFISSPALSRWPLWVIYHQIWCFPRIALEFLQM